MSQIYLTSDLHLFHDREFVYKPRGFDTVHEMNEAIIDRWKDTIEPEDDIYILGDIALGGPDALPQTLEILRALPGRLHLVRGNHDTNKRWYAYTSLPNVVEMQNAIYLDYRKYHFYLSHYPTLTGNLEKKSLHQCTLDLYGHTHQRNNFYQDLPYMYHVGVDSHNCFPVPLDQIIDDMKNKVKECINEL